MKFLEEQKPETLERYKELVPMFKEMGELHHILEEMRMRRGAISFEDREAKVLVDEKWSSPRYSFTHAWRG